MGSIIFERKVLILIITDMFYQGFCSGRAKFILKAKLKMLNHKNFS